MNFVSNKIKLIEWEKLKLKKLEAPSQSIQTNIKDVKFPKEWSLVGPIDESTPLLSFYFPPPLLQYGGELKKATGTLILLKDKNLENAIGKFEVDVSSLEMGVSSLNTSVKETMLFVKKFPKADLVFKRILSNDFTLELGKITRADIEANLTIMQKTGAVVATTQFEPFLNDHGELLLHVTTKFLAKDLLGTFEIEGPDGPDHANNQMYFDADFVMKAELEK